MKISTFPCFIFLQLLAGALALSPVNVSASGTNSIRLAVIPFFTPPDNGNLQQLATRMPDLLIVELSHEGRFQLVEREKVNAIWGELHLAEAGFVSAETVETFGHILSCDWLVSGSVVPTGSITQIWVKVIDVQSSVVLDLQTFSYDPTNLTTTVSAISTFLAQVNPHSQPRQFIALGKFADTSASYTHGDWSQHLSALIEKHFLAAGDGVVEREAVAPIFSEFQLESAGLTGDSTNRVKLKPAFWIVDGGCKWIYDTQEKVSVVLRVQKVGGGEQIFRFTKPPGDELEKAVVESIQSALTDTNQMTLEQAQAAEADVAAARAKELASGRDEIWTSLHYSTNSTFLTVTDDFGGKRQLTVNPVWLASRQQVKSDAINALKQAILLNTNDMHSKYMLGWELFQNVDPVESRHGRDLLEEVATSGDATYSTRAKNMLEDFDTGRLTIKHLPLGQVQIVRHGQSVSEPFVNHAAQTNLATQIAKFNEITNIATRAESFAQIPSPPATGYFEGITAVKFWQGKVLVASGTTLQSYDLATESTVEIRLPLKLEHPITAIEADENDLWLGTGGDGLVRIPKNGGTPRTFGEKDGFPTPSISALRLMQGRLLIGVGDSFGYLDTKTETFTGLMSEVSTFKSWKEAAQNPPESSVTAINIVDGTNIWVASDRALQRLDFGSQKWSLALPGAPDSIQKVAVNSNFMAAMVPMRCVAIYKRSGNLWTSVNVSTNFDKNLADSLAIDQMNPGWLWVGGNHGKVTIIDMDASTIIGECNLADSSHVRWIFDCQDTMIFIAEGRYAGTYDLYCLQKSALSGTSQQTMSSVGPDSADWRLSFLQKNFGKFVPVQFQKDANGDALIQRLHVSENMFGFNDTYFLGYKFTTPQWLDGNFEWMFALAKTEEEKFFASQNTLAGIIPEIGRSAKEGFDNVQIEELENYPQLHRQFPYSHSLNIQDVEMSRLEPGKTYGIWFEVQEKNHPDIAFAITINSMRGTNEFGRLPLFDTTPTSGK